MNSFGIEPPTTSFSNTKPEPGGSGSKSIDTSANWPEPPVCFLWVYLIETGLRQRFAIGHLRRADIGVHFISAAQDIDFDFEMQFAHALEDRLAGFLIGGDAEGRVFLRKAIERHAHLFLIGLGLRLDGDLDHRIGEFHALQDHRIVADRTAFRRWSYISGPRTPRCRRHRLPSRLRGSWRASATCGRRARSCPSPN